MGQLDGYAIILTGASSGIGSATAAELAKEGAAILVLQYRHNRAGAMRVAEQAEKNGARTVLVKADLEKRSEAFRLVATAAKTTHRRIDALICLHGRPATKRSWFRPFEKVSEHEFEAPLKADLLGSAYCCQAVSPYMRARKYGKIVLISSTPAVTGDEVGIPFLMAKAGVAALTKSLSLYFGRHNIHVNALALGSVATPANLRLMTPSYRRSLAEWTALKRFLTPQEVARKIVYLASPLSDGQTGDVMLVAAGPY